MDMKETVLEELKQIEEQKGVRVLLAVESGSRAWGFASPDSDYDVRFVYVRPATEYLRLDEPGDVIEWKQDAVLDINGWDIRKALKHFAHGNATLFEWSCSPIVYRTTPEWEKIMAEAKEYFSEKAAIHHYRGMAKKTWVEYLEGEEITYKKYFYALRPLLAAQYIERFHDIPPVQFVDLFRCMDLSKELRDAIDELLEKKKSATENEKHAHIPIIRDYIQKELTRQKDIADNTPDDRKSDCAPLNKCFLELVGLQSYGI